MIPITKNIKVTCENGSFLEPTYLRRAKGLVKNGRARWVDDETIYLSTATCPPKIMEDSKMDINVLEYIKEQIDFLKQELSSEMLLIMGLELQPQIAAEIVKARETTKQQIILLINRLLDVQNHEDSNEYYRSILENSINDKDVAIQAINKLKEIAEHESSFEVVDSIQRITDHYYDQKLTVIQGLLSKRV